MFGIGTTELIVIIIVALIVLGPEKLPKIAKSVGKSLGEFKRMATDVQDTFKKEMDRLEDEDKKKEAQKVVESSPPVEERTVSTVEADKPSSPPEVRAAPPEVSGPSVPVAVITIPPFESSIKPASGDAGIKTSGVDKA